jgi:hypothetical protein
MQILAPAISCAVATHGAAVVALLPLPPAAILRASLQTLHSRAAELAAGAFSC